MNFNSWQFVAFFVIVFFLYYILPHRFRWIMLLAASYYFYASWNPDLIILIFGTTLVTYLCGGAIDKESSSPKQKKLFLVLGVSVPLLVLFFFKYFNFFSESVTAALRAFSLPVNPVTLSVILPVGISFYTFQTLSYVIDVYRGNMKAERHFGIYALYVSFFPQLVAGPIERSGNLLPQFYEEHSFSYESVTFGLKTMAWGFFKKMAIADILAEYVETAYSRIPEMSGLSLALATVFFAFQVYCDFSGYSDIAIGAAGMMGIKLMKNFSSPYFSKSVKEFWRRWHISLSSWFMDYIYIPLGGNRVALPRYYLNLLITFTVSGLWHGAKWTFVLWGVLHGVYLIIGSAAEKLRSRAYSALHINNDGPLAAVIKTALTFGFVCFGWIFFRAASIEDALSACAGIFAGPYSFELTLTELGLTAGALIDIVVVLLVLAAFDAAALKTDVVARIGKLSAPARWAVYIVFALFTVLYIQKGVPAEFIYFQF